MRFDRPVWVASGRPENKILPVASGCFEWSQIGLEDVRYPVQIIDDIQTPN